MSITSRKPRPLDRAVAVRDARLIVVATEGEKTEEIYFSIFRSTKIQVKIIPCSGGKSAPEHVFHRLLEYREQFQLEGDDELWLAIDRDKWKDKSLSEVARRCKNEKIGLALSNPCFEIWLSMHYSAKFSESLNSTQATKLFRKHHGSFNKSKFDAVSLIPKVPTAIANAKALDDRPKLRWPIKTGSRVYRLVESILTVNA